MSALTDSRLEQRSKIDLLTKKSDLSPWSEWSGRHIKVQTDPFQYLLSQFAIVIICTLGVSLLTTLGLATIPVTVLGGALFAYTLIAPSLREKMHENWLKTKIYQKLKCAEDFNNLPIVHWKSQNNFQICVHLQRKDLASPTLGMRATKEEKLAIPFIIRKDPIHQRLQVYSFGPFKDKQFVFTLEEENKTIEAIEKPFSIPLFYNKYPTDQEI
ncbi:MAG: hypothetical protein BGO14_07745 [Chlamydiales bacterium 38-26]|nr:hypothetical protein [Chlamydiales bacterium]OJV10890.1 MAG: hypothetical protein BGO14_07745 [Chlamydiales bacterium 38-26]